MRFTLRKSGAAERFQNDRAATLKNMKPRRGYRGGLFIFLDKDLEKPSKFIIFVESDTPCAKAHVNKKKLCHVYMGGFSILTIKIVIMQTVAHQDTVQSIIWRLLGDSVSIVTAQKLKEAGFPQPEKALLGQKWYTESGHIIASIARNDYSGELWWRTWDTKEAINAMMSGDETKQKLWQPLNETNEKLELRNYHDPLSVFMPRDSDLKKEMDGWVVESDSIIGLYTCYLVASPEVKFQSNNEHEVCAMALLSQIEKQRNLKESAER